MVTNYHPAVHFSWASWYPRTMDSGWSVGPHGDYDTCPSVWFKVRKWGPFMYVWTKKPSSGDESFQLVLNIGFTRFAVGW